MIDLRSDTVTKPSPKMLDSMMRAEVGDDVFNEDPSINALQVKACELFGMEAALFCPSGTMTNQIAIATHVGNLEEIILEKDSHIYQYEGGGIFHNSRASVKLLDGKSGKITAKQIRDAINPDDIHKPISRLVSLENTTNRGGGETYSLSELKEILEVVRQNNLKLHLDGARVFNAIIEEDYTPKDLGAIFDSISICLSKGLGAPVGSLLLGDKEFIAKAKRLRKVLGGGMRQAGFLAQAGIYALDNNIERLKEDHQLAKDIGELLSKFNFIEKVIPVRTNIIIFHLDEDVNPQEFLEYLKSKNILAVHFGGQAIRFVTHLDLEGDIISEINKVLSEFN
ncbi:L-allo-threonine aldolase, PLP-dependent [Halobacteriovorax marinus SJ]|uniref:L-allo-threonine aldolase, PLP-dependent n=1 Tax=Halobacteriovorax marinus (strain ATCC BAA-682 / DSM 15412 / SJ) TaxID=862908 RepID=E1X5R9_HALMS|nr:GntG family PLP-dependent aldolase [Halobacteriovorax marinus]CBW25636.1 L-allo-threonine aldolase, PLP-dependent [Halobacteriovorax marinus SJ]